MFAVENRFLDFIHGGQVDPELGPVSRCTRYSNESAALSHDSVNDREPKAGPSADFLRGEEWLKDSCLRCLIHPKTGVLNHQHDVWNKGLRPGSTEHPLRLFRRLPFPLRTRHRVALHRAS